MKNSKKKVLNQFRGFPCHAARAARGKERTLKLLKGTRRTSMHKGQNVAESLAMIEAITGILRKVNVDTLSGQRAMMVGRNKKFKR